jgi:glycosyltransferase involved in cell wall biosynthesis
MSLSLIITTYNKPDALFLVMQSISCQSILPSEVIIADDGSDKKTQKLINNFIKDFDFPVIHSWQDDIGFRAARSRNSAISCASGEYIVLIDGDMILHYDFIKDHINSIESSFFVQGSRVLLSESVTKQLLERQKINFSFFSSGLKNRKNSLHSKILAKIFSNKRNHLHGIKSCNMGFYRKDCLNVNGFNNDFEGWGREDSEFAVRLMNNNIKRKNLRFNAIQFHLWHNENSRQLLKKNEILLQNSITKRLTWCENGIISLEKNES